MRSPIRGILAVTGGTAAALVPFLGYGTAHAAVRFARTIYVSPNGGGRPTGGSCASGLPSIQEAVSKAGPGDTVIVCPSLRPYQEPDITIKTPGITLEGQGKPIIDADPSGPGDGIIVEADDVLVAGLYVEEAPECGIEVNGADHVQIIGNTLAGNGAGLCIVDSSFVFAHENTASENDVFGIGVLDSLPDTKTDLTSKSPASSDNVIADNVTDKNGDVGILLGSTGAAFDDTAAPALTSGGDGGVFDNKVIHNVVEGNGRVPLAERAEAMPAPVVTHAAGILLTNDFEAAAAKEADPLGNGNVFDNLVAYNTLVDNGGPGVSLLDETETVSKMLAKPRPGNMNDNTITANNIQQNNTLPSLSPEPVSAKAKAATILRTTGILLESTSPVVVHVLNNLINDNFYGIVATDNVSPLTGLQFNVFLKVLVPVFIIRTKIEV